MLNIQGIIVKGESSASGKNMNWNGFGSIYHQVNFLKNNHLQFAKKLIDCKMATINIKLNNSFTPKYWEYTFDKVFWLPDSNAWSEKLSFTSIQFIFKNKQIDAWLYKAYKSPHCNDNYLIEVLAPLIENLNTHEVCEIAINKKYI